MSNQVNRTGEQHRVSEQRNDGEDARAAVSDQQMRSGTPRYPVDRYLVDSSKKFEMVNIIDDDIWNPEPALKPEDEIMLRKLHEMLQSTADDLKMLSGELSKYRESRVQMKKTPTPLDEDFNEKVHIEEVVNAKFHGYKIVDNPLQESIISQHNKINETKTKLNVKTDNITITKNLSSQVNGPIHKKPKSIRNLSLSRTRIIQIDEINNKNNINNNNDNLKKMSVKPPVTYKEFCFKYNEPISNSKAIPRKVLQVQEMPSINIRNELKEQKVLQLDILPSAVDIVNNNMSKNNVVVIAMEHKVASLPKPSDNINLEESQTIQHYHITNEHPLRKVHKMSTGESSESTNHSDAQRQLINKTHKQREGIKISSTNSTFIHGHKNKKGSLYKKEPEKHSQYSLENWKKKVNAVYGPSSTSRKGNVTMKSNPNLRKGSSKKSLSSPNVKKSKPNVLNNANYIPYSQLTLGGVKVSDIEKEITDIPNKSDFPLSPILNKIINSQECSFHNDSPRKYEEEKSPRIFTTSDENLLQEVIDIEKTISTTLPDNLKKETIKTPANKYQQENNQETDSYDDDFENDETDNPSIASQKESPEIIENQFSNRSNTGVNVSEAATDGRMSNSAIDDNQCKKNIPDETYIKVSNLSLKKSVDIFEFVPFVETQDIATQSTTIQKISLKETQTSPRNEKSNLQSIHNDLWPSIDPRGEVEKMFKLEKDFIKKLIIDEYGDLIQKPSTSNKCKEHGDQEINIATFQKNTQTSPAHVKSVMTSPTNTKTRTTSPFSLPLKVDQHTSPSIFDRNGEKFNVEIDDDENNLDISVNLSSPRFNLRLPQTSREVLSNLESSLISKQDKYEPKDTTYRKVNNKISSKPIPNMTSTSSDANNSSSDISSLGEVKLKFKRLHRGRRPSISGSSSSSTISKYSSDVQEGVLPLRSEGEISLGQTNSRSKPSKSDGEVSFGLI